MRASVRHAAEAGVGDRRQEALWLATQGFAESDLVFEIGANARRLAAEFPGGAPRLGRGPGDAAQRASFSAWATRCSTTLSSIWRPGWW
jgi:hypothetical protein